MPQPAKKSERMDAFVAALGHDEALAFHPCYQGYFTCFNEGRYYEAHDVLEHLWLRDGPTAPDYAFYKGLIQLAGAYVHLRKQFEHPTHVKHGRRLRPAMRLFELAHTNLSSYAPRHYGLDVAAVLALCTEQARAIAETGCTRNPWSPEATPRLWPEGMAV